MSNDVLTAGVRAVFEDAARGFYTVALNEAGEIIGHTALRRWGAPSDHAGAYRFLVSDASAFVTGTVISVDGGYLLS